MSNDTYMERSYVIVSNEKLCFEEAADKLYAYGFDDSLFHARGDIWIITTPKKHEEVYDRLVSADFSIIPVSIV